MLLRIDCPRCGAEYAHQIKDTVMWYLTCVNDCGHTIMSRSEAKEVIAFYLTPYTKEEPDATED